MRLGSQPERGERYVDFVAVAPRAAAPPWRREAVGVPVPERDIPEWLDRRASLTGGRSTRPHLASRWGRKSIRKRDTWRIKHGRAPLAPARSDGSGSAPRTHPIHFEEEIHVVQHP